jgi:hypothetical protein
MAGPSNLTAVAILLAATGFGFWLAVHVELVPKSILTLGGLY